MEEELEKIIKECNLLFTNTKKRTEIEKKEFDREHTTINFDNCISIYKLLESFNTLYHKFREEYQTAKKPELFSHSTDIIQFDKSIIDGKTVRNAIIDFPEGEVTLYEEDGEIDAIYECIYDGDHGTKYIRLNQEEAKSYLDLLEKYELLINVYRIIKYNSFYSDYITRLYAEIEKQNSGSIINGIDKITLIFQKNSYEGKQSDKNIQVEIPFTLKEKVELDYENCKLIINGTEMPLEDTTYDTILEKIYINKKELNK